MTSSIKPHPLRPWSCWIRSLLQRDWLGNWVFKAWSRQSLLESHHWGVDHQQWLGVHQEVRAPCRRDLTQIGESQSNILLCWWLAGEKWNHLTEGVPTKLCKDMNSMHVRRETNFLSATICAAENTWIWQDDELCLRQILAAATWVEAFEATCSIRSMFQSFSRFSDPLGLAWLGALSLMWCQGVGRYFLGKMTS